MKRRKILIFFLLIIIIVMLMITLLDNNKKIIEINENQKKDLSDIPFRAEGDSNIINNNYFSIDSTGKEAKKTRSGINEAFKYASENNIEQIKFEKGIYLINLSSENIGIILNSNLDIDFNGSTIILESNANTHSSLLYLKSIENVTLKNATIIGDSKTHQFVGNSTHEWGYGIYIISGKNIKVENMQIQSCIGDGILIDGKETMDISVLNCNIFDCRRQGISITSGTNIKIINNEIHDIKGTNPQSAIDLEIYQEDKTINYIEIKNNKIYKLNTNLAIIVDRGTYNVNIEENDIEGNIGVNCVYERAIITNNEIKNGMINVYENDNKIKYGNRVNYVEIYNNKIENSNIILSRIKKANIYENYIKNGTIQLDSTYAAIYNNKIENTEATTKKYAYRYTTSIEGNYIIYSVNNEEKGEFETIVLNENEDSVIENNNINDLEKYLNTIQEVEEK